MNTPKNIVIIRSVKKGFIVCLKLTILFGIIFSIVYQQFSLKGIGSTFLASAMFSYGIGFGNGFLNDYLNTKWDWITQTKQRVTAGIIGTIIYTIPVVLGINYVIWIVIGGADIAMFFSGSSLFIHLFYIIISFGVSSFLHAKAFMTNWKIAMTQESTKQEIVAKTETAKFESLKSQLDPHFLFNSLNVLTSLIGENPYKAEKFTTKLSKIYRYVLEQRNKDLIPVLEEIKFANTYMELLGMRFEDAVKFEIPSSITNKNLKIV
ncbi:MAG: histidine kinase, partial [Flavobacterium sp.]|nr:histidine kinase [Flavobacterium sp.]